MSTTRRGFLRALAAVSLWGLAPKVEAQPEATFEDLHLAIDPYSMQRALTEEPGWGPMAAFLATAEGKQAFKELSTPEPRYHFFNPAAVPTWQEPR